MNIPVDSPLAFIGFVCLAVGGFMVLAGLDIIKVQQVSVKQGTRTWVVGVVFVLVGIALLYPELVASRGASDDDAPTVAASSPAPDPGDAADPPPESADPPAGSAAVGAEWSTVDFKIPSETLWTKTEDGSYTPIGTGDTFAWTEESFSGDLEMEFDVKGDSAAVEAVVLVFGDGEGFSPGTLIFGVAHDHRKIMSDTVYEKGTFLYSDVSPLDLQKTVRTVRITVAGDAATLSLDGKEIASATLGGDINKSGRIGLYRCAETRGVTYSDIRVRIPSKDGG